jgi:hypothetical protein
MISYDGRLFVTVQENDGTDITSQTVLYVLSGSAMTQLKRWGKVGRQGGGGRYMALHDGRLYYPATNLLGMQEGFGIAVYDAAEDAHSIFAANSDTTTYADSSPFIGGTYAVEGVYSWKGRLWASVHKHGVFKTAVSFRDYMLSRNQATYDLTGTAETNGGWLTSSTFDGGNAINKMWRRILVEALIPSADTSFELDYSLDGGTTWVPTTMVLKTSNGQEKVYEVLLENIFSRRLKYRLRLQTENEDETPVIRSVVIAYMMMPDPQWMWEFVIPVSELQHLLDGTEEVVDTEERLALLRSLFRDRELHTFRDIDGTLWGETTPGVLVYDYTEAVNFIDNQTKEGDVRLVLLEALEGED